MKKICCLVFCVILALSCLGLWGCKKEEKTACRYEIFAEYREKARTLVGTVKVEYCNPYEKELSKLNFHLYANAYRKNALLKPLSESYLQTAYYQGESYGDITITSVDGGKNWSIEGQDENVLSVSLIRPLAPKEKITLDVSFVTTLAKVRHTTGVTERCVNLANAFPVLCGFDVDGEEFVEIPRQTFGNPFAGEYADYKISLTVPSNYTVACGVEQFAEKELESKTKYVMEGASLRDFAVVLSKNYEVAELKTDKTTLRYYYYDDSAPVERLAFAKSALEFYEKSFGEYPYPVYSLAQTELCVDSSAYPTLLFLSDSLGLEDLMKQIAFGTAKQWWYAGLGVDRINCAWLEEGLTAYSSVLFFEKYSDYGVSRENVIKKALEEYHSYFSVYGSIFGGVDTSMRKQLQDFSGEYEYRCLTYDKSIIMWDTLRKSIGEKKFEQALKSFYQSNRQRKVGEKELFKAFEKTGVDVVGFFESFLSGEAVI